MKIRKKVPISFNFSNSTAEMVKKFYESHEYKHSTIYLAGIEALRRKEVKQDENKI